MDPAPGAEGFRCGFVAVAGRPNVGKSTLVNAYVGEKVAIVSRRPQTTRRRILGILSTAEAQVVFIDTPGIRQPNNPLGQYMVRGARRAIGDADLVVCVVDVSRLPSSGDRTVAGWIEASGQPVILAMNKSDLLAPADIAAHTAAYVELMAPAEWTLTISTEGHNLDRLWQMIVARLPQGPPLYPADQITDQTERAMAAELVREAALRYLSDEVPHGLAVAVDEWAARDNGVLFIAATVVVERQGHKAIVVGAGGRMIRRIGSAARRGIEGMVGGKVYLDLRVKVRPSWRRHAADVRRLMGPQ